MQLLHHICQSANFHKFGDLLRMKIPPSLLRSGTRQICPKLPAVLSRTKAFQEQPCMTDSDCSSHKASLNFATESTINLSIAHKTKDLQAENQHRSTPGTYPHSTLDPVELLAVVWRLEGRVLSLMFLLLEGLN